MTANPHDPTARGDELGLLAQCYVLGELDATTNDAFEMRLADDQEAREAVARVVALAEASALDARTATATPATAQAHPRWSRTRWLTAAAIAAIAIGLTITLGGSRSDEDSEQLIASWMDLGEVASDSLAVSDTEDTDPTDDAYDWLFSALEEKNR